MDTARAWLAEYEVKNPTTVPRDTPSIKELRAKTVRNIIKGYLTTGDISYFTKVAPRTVSKWCDTGKLESIRIPDSQDRRIPLAAFLAFCQQHKYPIHPILNPTRGIWVIEGYNPYQLVDKITDNALLSVESVTVFSPLMAAAEVATPGTILPKYLVISPTVDNNIRIDFLRLFQSNFMATNKVANVFDSDTCRQELSSAMTMFPKYIHIWEHDIQWSKFNFMKGSMFL